MVPLFYAEQLILQNFSYNIRFGAGITRRLNESYQLAKAHSGIITTLPFVASEAAPSDEERLHVGQYRPHHSMDSGAQV
jgi:hypothetical protein